MNRGTTSKERLLEAACKVFAEKGFKDATVAEICDLAGMNVASVNYHFRDKDNLYLEVWRHSWKLSCEEFPLQNKSDALKNPKESLECFIRNMLGRILCEGKGGYFSKLHFRELSDPTPAGWDLVRSIFLPQLAVPRLAIAGLVFGDKARDMDFGDHESLYEDDKGRLIGMCLMSVMSQCLFLGFNRFLREKMLKNHGADQMKNKLAMHIACFCLAGIDAVRLQAQAHQLPENK